MEKYWDNKEWLEIHYSANGMSIISIAKSVGAGYSTIATKIKKYGIKTRTPMQTKLGKSLDYKFPYEDKNWLMDQYSKKPLTDIAKEIGCLFNTLCFWMDKHNIPIRSSAESYHMKHGNSFINDDRIHEIIVGELLGDGCVCKATRYSALYRHGTCESRIEYLYWLANIFKQYGIEVGYTRHTNKLNKTTINLYTKRYSNFLYYRQWFYPTGKKIVPRDLIITPIVLLHWYMGDGTLKVHHDNTKPSIQLATMGFTYENNLILVNKLTSVGLPFVIHTYNRSLHQLFTLSLGSAYTQAFLNFIGPCPCDVYAYKWDLSRTPNEINRL